MSEDDLVRFFGSDLGDTSRDGGGCIPLHPSPPAPTPASRRDRACRDLDLPKKLCRESGFFATGNLEERFKIGPPAASVNRFFACAVINGPQSLGHKPARASRWHGGALPPVHARVLAPFANPRQASSVFPLDRRSSGEDA